MAQTDFELIETDDGQTIVEASCPHDNTIKPRAIKKVVQPIIAEPKERDLIAPEPVKPTGLTVTE